MQQARVLTSEATAENTRLRHDLQAAAERSARVAALHAPGSTSTSWRNEDGDEQMQVCRRLPLCLVAAPRCV